MKMKGTKILRKKYVALLLGILCVLLMTACGEKETTNYVGIITEVGDGEITIMTMGDENRMMPGNMQDFEGKEKPEGFENFEGFEGMERPEGFENFEGFEGMERPEEFEGMEKLTQGETITLKVSKKTEITINGETADLIDLNPGDSVEIVATNDTAINITVGTFGQGKRQ